MLLNLTKKIDELCKYSENIVEYKQLGSYNMLDSTDRLFIEITRFARRVN